VLYVQLTVFHLLLHQVVKLDTLIIGRGGVTASERLLPVGTVQRIFVEGTDRVQNSLLLVARKNRTGLLIKHQPAGNIYILVGLILHLKVYGDG